METFQNNVSPKASLGYDNSDFEKKSSGRKREKKHESTLLPASKKRKKKEEEEGDEHDPEDPDPCMAGCGLFAGAGMDGYCFKCVSSLLNFDINRHLSSMLYLMQVYEYDERG